MSAGERDSEPRWVYSFEEADGSRRDLLGGKGAELARMTSLGLPVPPGFVITTEVSIFVVTARAEQTPST